MPLNKSQTPVKQYALLRREKICFAKKADWAHEYLWLYGMWALLKEHISPPTTTKLMWLINPLREISFTYNITLY